MEHDDELKAIYYDPKNSGSLGGVQPLFREAKIKNPAITIDQVKEFLRRQRTYSLHKPYRKKFHRNRTIVGSIDKQWQADLADMTKLGRSNGGYRYILTCIDCFSRFAWAVPVKRKSADNLEEAFTKLFKQANPRVPQRIQTDKGKEFFNSKVRNLFKAKGIHHFASESEFKAAVVERFNRTLKTKLWHYFTAKSTNRFLEVLPDILHSYNHTVHRSIGMKPADVTSKDELKIWMKNKTPEDKSRKEPVKEGDVVRISKSKTIFEKGYLPNWTEELFKVTGKVRHPKKVYKLKDFGDEEIKGTFYKQNIQDVPKEPIYLVEKQLRKRKVGNQTEVLIKWFGWPEKFNSWIAETDIVNYGE